jgi:hypothetical protein
MSATDTFVPSSALQALRQLVGRVKAIDAPLALELADGVGHVLVESEQAAILAMLDGRGWVRSVEEPMDEEVARLLGEAVAS